MYDLDYKEGIVALPVVAGLSWNVLSKVFAGLFGAGTSLGIGISAKRENARLKKEALELAERERKDRLKAQQQAFGLEERKLGIGFGVAKEAKKQNEFSRKQKIADRGLQLVSGSAALRSQMSDLWSSVGVLNPTGGGA